MEISQPRIGYLFANIAAVFLASLASTTANTSLLTNPETTTSNGFHTLRETISTFSALDVHSSSDVILSSTTSRISKMINQKKMGYNDSSKNLTVKTPRDDYRHPFKDQELTCFSVNDSQTLVSLTDEATCSNRCGITALTRNQITGLGTCQCDIWCTIYDSCCADFFKECPDIYNQYLKSYSRYHLKSQCLTRYNFGYQVISSCIPGAPRWTELKCLAPGNEKPISHGSLHFRNEYCLLCNGFNLSNARFWNSTVKLLVDRKLASKIYLEIQVLDIIKLKGYWYYESFPDSAACSRYVIDSCPINSVVSINQKCRTSLGYVIDTSTKMLFKNIFCALCNRIDGADNCYREIVPQDLVSINPYKGLSFLLKWSSNASSAGGILVAKLPLLWKTIYCKTGIEDLSAKNCHITKCQSNSRLVENKCVDTVQYCVKVFLQLRLQNSDEYRIELHSESRFKLLSNISMLILEHTKDSASVQSHYSNYPNWNKNKPKYTILSMGINIIKEPLFATEEIKYYIVNITRILLSKDHYRGEFSLCVNVSDVKCSITRACEKAKTYQIYPETSKAYRIRLRKLSWLFIVQLAFYATYFSLFSL